MIALVYLRDVVACFVAVLFFCIVMSLPKKALFLSSFFGTATYIIYRLLYFAGQEILGYLAATFFAAVSAEILARFCKMPTTVFVFPGIVPLVPGVGLHRSLIYLINDNISGFVSQGINTLFISGIIAVTVAVVNAFFRSVLSKSGDQKSRFNSMRH
jgi:uncharacterized membrane protein YjjB (DUF3815 family)